MIGGGAIFVGIVLEGWGIWADTEWGGKWVGEQFIPGMKNSKNKFTAVLINLLLMRKSKDISLPKVEWARSNMVGNDLEEKPWAC